MKPKSIFITYKENAKNLLDATSDLTYNRRLLSKCNPNITIKRVEYEKNYNDLLETIVKLEEYIKSIKTFQKEIEKEIRDYANKFNDLEYRVYISYHIENKSLMDIAEEEKYAYGYIRHISCNLNKKIE